MKKMPKLLVIAAAIILMLSLVSVLAFAQGLPAVTAYAWLVYSTGGGVPYGPVTVTIPEGNLSSIKATSIIQMAGADFVNDVWYAVEINSPSSLYTIDTTTGDHTLIGSTGVNSMTGLAYDVTSQTLYASNFDGGNSNLYTVDPATGQGEYVGRIVYNEIIIGIAADVAGNLYGLNINDDCLYAIDKSTGAGTLIGPTGLDLNYAQDIAFDRINGILYGTLYSTNTGGGLYQINTTTGAAALLHEFGDEVAALAIPYLINGTISVTIEPAAARDAGAQWQVGSDNIWRNSGDVVELTPGVYPVTFSEIEGWDKPESTTLTLSSGGIVTYAGTYARHTGSLSVSIEPAAARSAGAQWRLTSGVDTSWKNSGDAIADLPTGSYTLEFKEIDGYELPSTINVIIEKDVQTEEIVTYEAEGETDEKIKLPETGLTLSNGLMQIGLTAILGGLLLFCCFAAVANRRK